MISLKIKAIKTRVLALYHFFPIQLLILHIKKHQFFLLLWMLLFAAIFQSFGKEYGIPFLLLDPEYMGKVNYISFFIVGACFGGFVVTWHISTYTLSSYQFQFLAAFKRPFAVYLINNSTLPAFFLLTYFVLIYQFQIKNALIFPKNVFAELGSFLIGFLFTTLVSMLYFMATNANVFKLLKLNVGNLKQIGKKVVVKQNKLFINQKFNAPKYPVDTLVSLNLRLRSARNVEHYSDELIQSIFKQNHYNAFIIQMAFVSILITLSYFIENPYFRIPSGASIFLLFGLLTSISGFLNFWIGAWKAPFIVFLILIINFLVKNQVLRYNNHAYGLNYNTTKAPYNYTSFQQLSSDSLIEHDKLNTLSILKSWKKQTGQAKPKIVFLNFTGGGASAATFSTLILQKADSILDGNLLRNTFLMTGASGGMLGAAYFREIYLQKRTKKIDSYYNEKYANNIAKDLLNPVVFTILVNDLGLPFRKFKYKNNTYIKDRGFIFERVFNENTNFVLDKSLKEYKQYEEVAIIPMLIFVPTIINDQRKLYISTQPVSYLTKPLNPKFKDDLSRIDGIDFQALFKTQNAEDLRFSTAIRMNATYPYILPYVALPSEPEIKVMDAGFRDNYGIETTTKFIHTFKDWINENTSGAVIVQVRSNKRKRELLNYERETVLTRMAEPVTNIYANFLVRQEYDQNYLIDYCDEWLNGKLEFINFEYIPESKDEEASLSLHLTDKEKQDIRKTIDRIYTKLALRKLKKALEPSN